MDALLYFDTNYSCYETLQKKTRHLRVRFSLHFPIKNAGTGGEGGERTESERETMFLALVIPHRPSLPFLVVSCWRLQPIAPAFKSGFRLGTPDALFFLGFGFFAHFLKMTKFPRAPYAPPPKKSLNIKTTPALHKQS